MVGGEVFDSFREVVSGVVEDFCGAHRYYEGLQRESDEHDHQVWDGCEELALDLLEDEGCDWWWLPLRWPVLLLHRFAAREKFQSCSTMKNTVFA